MAAHHPQPQSPGVRATADGKLELTATTSALALLAADAAAVEAAAHGIVVRTDTGAPVPPRVAKLAALSIALRTFGDNGGAPAIVDDVVKVLRGANVPAQLAEDVADALVAAHAAVRPEEAPSPAARAELLTARLAGDLTRGV